MGICLMGGAQLAGTLLPEIDELVIKVYPVVVGAGIPLFTTAFSPTRFAHTGSRTLDSGTVVLTYART
jgi:dihydrofolate reductase